jgi:hypothetical protein
MCHLGFHRLSNEGHDDITYELESDWSGFDISVPDSLIE